MIVATHLPDLLSKSRAAPGESTEMFEKRLLNSFLYDLSNTVPGKCVAK